MRVALAIVALSLAVPLGQAESLPTPLYMHMIGVMDMPINTQSPPSEYADEAYYGPTVTLTCAHPLTGDLAGTGQGTGGTTSQAYHTMYGYATPSLLEYESPSADGRPRLHPARGIGGNVTVDTAQPMALHWFLRESPRAEGLQVPAVVPDVIVRAAIRAGDAISIDDEAYNAGPLLFHGQAGPATLLNGEATMADGASGEVRVAGQFDGSWVYEFILPLVAESPVIPFIDGFNVRLDTMLQVPGCDATGATVMPSTLAGHTSDGMRPRLEWSVVDLMAPGFVHLELDDEGQLQPFLHAGTVFGDYDTKDRVVRLTRDGEEVPLETTQVSGYGPCGHDCGHAMQTRYSLADGRPQPGLYNLTVSYSNLAGTAQRTMSAELLVEPANGSPSPAPALLLLALAAMALRRR